MATAAELAALKAVVPAAQASFAKWGVPASITLAQWMLESGSKNGWGTSQLSRKANNYFGIKAMHLSAPDAYEQFPTGEYENGRYVVVEALFQKFPDEAACFDAHGQLLATAARYKPAMAVAPNPFAFASLLQRCGYSSASGQNGTKSYSAMLMELITDYNLTQYDTPPPAVAREIAA